MGDIFVDSAYEKGWVVFYLLLHIAFLCRIIRAFLIEEQKIVVHAMKAKAGQKWFI